MDDTACIKAGFFAVYLIWWVTGYIMMLCAVWRESTWWGRTGARRVVGVFFTATLLPICGFGAMLCGPFAWWAYTRTDLYTAVAPRDRTPRAQARRQALRWWAR